jgi:hypothetical protein
LLIVDELDPEPASLSDLFQRFRTLSTEQQREVGTFIDYVRYRDGG